MDYQELKEKIFIYAYNEALDDATKRVVQESVKEKIKNNGSVRKCVRDYIVNTIEGKYPDFYETARKVAKEINIEGFSFGNIQKLINMTAKNIYISCFCNSELRDRFKKAHCPMDKRMIREVVKEYRKYIKKEEKDKSGINNRLTYIDEEDNKTQLWSELGWSKISWKSINSYPEENAYARYQDMVLFLAEKEGLSPLEYDFYKW